MFPKVWITVSPLGSLTHLVVTSSVHECVLATDILGYWSIHHTKSLDLWGNYQHSKENKWKPLKLHPKPGQNSKFKAISHPRGDDREIKTLQDLRKAGVRVILLVLFHLLDWAPIKTKWILENGVDDHKLNQGVATTRVTMANKIFLWQ